MGMDYSVNSNANAFLALEKLNNTQRQLNVTQNRISSGKKVENAKDNGMTWAIAKNQNSTLVSLQAVSDSLERGKSTVDVGMAAGASVSELLTQMRLKALAATDTSLDSAARIALNDDYVTLRDSLTQTVDNAEFNGYNLIRTFGIPFQALANAAGTSTVTVSAANLGYGAFVIAIAATSVINTPAQAATQLAKLTASVANVNGALAKMGAQAKRLDNYGEYISKLKDSIETGVANLVDADLAKESAKIQSLAVMQKMGVQALSIANQAPGILQSLFR